MGYLGEILYGIFIYYQKNKKNKKIKELPLVYFEYTQGLKKSRFKDFFKEKLVSMKLNLENIGYLWFPKNTRRRRFVKKIYYFLLK